MDKHRVETLTSAISNIWTNPDLMREGVDLLLMRELFREFSSVDKLNTDDM